MGFYGTHSHWSCFWPSSSSRLCFHSPVARGRLAMAVTLPVLGLSSSLLKPLRTHASTSSVSNSPALPLPCRIRASHRPHRIASNSSDPELLKSVEHCSGSGRSTQVAALAVAASSLLGAGASLADEVVDTAIDGSSDVGISTTVSVLFVAATVGLVVLTGGVIYLGLTEFLEKRALQEEQKKVAEAKPKKPTKQAVKAAARAGGPKGFGSSKRNAEDIGGSD